jgi:hypothetical protein
MLLPNFLIFQWAYMVPVVEKVQQDPQSPWSLTGVTTPKLVQSNESGSLRFFCWSETFKSWVAEHS